MKRAKRATKRQKKEAAKFLKELAKNQPEITIKTKVRKVKAIFSLVEFLKRKAKKKADKLQYRADRRASKKDHKGHNHK